MADFLRLRNAIAGRFCRWPRLYASALRLLRPGNYERELFLRILRRGDVTFDVGANFGDYTVLFANICGPRGVVHSFEPVPTSFEVLRSRVGASCLFENVELNRLAVSNHAGDVSLHVPGSDLGQASLRTHQAGSWLGGSVETTVTTARSTTLDAYIATWQSGPQFLKIDVEGAELLVLQGATGLLRRWRPLIHLEIFSGWTAAFGYQPRDLIRYLLEHGYDSFFLSNAGLRPLTDAEAEIQELEGSSNILCAQSQVHAGRIRRLLARSTALAA